MASKRDIWYKMSGVTIALSSLVHLEFYGDSKCVIMLECYSQLKMLMPKGGKARRVAAAW